VLSRFRRSLSLQAFGALFALMVVVGVALTLLFDAVSDQRAAAEAAERAEIAVSTAADLQGLVIDLETGERGFLVTGDPSFLSPYERARREYPKVSERLQQLVTTTASLTIASEIARGVEAYANDFLRPVVALARDDLEAARAVVARGEGKRRVDDLRALFGRLEAQETAFAEDRRTQAAESADRAETITVVALGVSMGLILVFGLFLRSGVVAPVRRLAQTADRVTHGDLAARVPDVHARNEVGQMGRGFNRMAESLERNRDAAEEAERVKDEFFALVSHELRTPLTSIVGYVELLAEDAEGIEELSPEERQRFLVVVNRNARRLLRLVGDLLFVARLEAGRMDLEETEFDLAEVVAESVEAALPRAEAQGVRLEAPPMAEVRTVGDPGRIAQALDNLVSNAIKFTPAGGSVTVGGRADGDQVVVEVADTGLGIPADEQEQLFERFFRSSSATDANVQGVGLGLTISKAIVEGHGGTLDFDSAEDEGTTFRVRLPIGSRGG
jgi:signal transduction histidine kinase